MICSERSDGATFYISKCGIQTRWNCISARNQKDFFGVINIDLLDEMLEIFNFNLVFTRISLNEICRESHWHWCFPVLMHRKDFLLDKLVLFPLRQHVRDIAMGNDIKLNGWNGCEDFLEFQLVENYLFTGSSSSWWFYAEAFTKLRHVIFSIS